MAKNSCCFFLQERQRSTLDHHLEKFRKPQIINGLYNVSRFHVSWFYRRIKNKFDLFVEISKVNVKQSFEQSW